MDNSHIISSVSTVSAISHNSM